MASPRGFALRFPEGVRCVAPFPVPHGHVCLLSGELSLRALCPCLVGSFVCHCESWGVFTVHTWPGQYVTRETRKRKRAPK